MPHRQEHGYPPISRLVRLIVRSRDAEAAAKFAARLESAIQQSIETPSSPHADAGVRILGPAEAPVFRLRGYYRFHFQLHSSSAAFLHDLLRTVLPTVRTPAGVEFTIDVDPLNML